ncbi:RluA family pseudouridine synthase [Neorhodopirellula lusitana]|uniref:RluA family pseudouridine synthase n=1 Tax=Neorhodopirellula lusitana TaxID=445327 RepID=UPI00384B0FC0
MSGFAKLVIYEDNHLLVVNKPAGVSTMGDENRQTLHTLAGAYLKQKYQKPHGVYVGIVSRLDAMTSGVIVLARTSKAAARLNVQFAQKSSSKHLEKTYLAIVQATNGVAANLSDKGTLSDYLYKDDAAHRMRATAGPQDGAKLAELGYRMLHRSDSYQVMSVVPKTGRKHQIRVQFATRGWPILGDRKYGSPLQWADGIALHSQRLTIEHPTRREPMTFECPPPESWNQYWRPASE